VALKTFIANMLNKVT